MGRKKKHEEAHGGAWKVAYADFVTAMMALFMVLWICAQEDEILVATTEYFRSPFTSPMPASSGVMNGRQESFNYDDNDATSHAFTPDMYKMLAKEFLKLLDIDPSESEENRPVDVKVSKDGIVISVFNHNNQPVFKGASEEFTRWGEFVAQNLAWVIDRFHMGVRIDGHVPVNAVDENSQYNSWTLSTGQAERFRKGLVHYGLDAAKISRISGFGDVEPIAGLDPESSHNYRVELILTATSDTPLPDSAYPKYPTPRRTLKDE